MLKLDLITMNKYLSDYGCIINVTSINNVYARAEFYQLCYDAVYSALCASDYLNKDITQIYNDFGHYTFTSFVNNLIDPNLSQTICRTANYYIPINKRKMNDIFRNALKDVLAHFIREYYEDLKHDA